MSSVAHIADASLFIASGSVQNAKFNALRTEARRTDRRFIIPERVYEELTDRSDGDETEYTTSTLPIDVAIEDGWVAVFGPLDYTNPRVATAMDDTCRYIARETDRQENTIEKADAALAGCAAQLLDTGAVDRVVVYTADIAAGEGIVAAITHSDLPDRIEFIEGFSYLENLTADPF
ncbi:hypothetical protein [Halocatena pleomorpha]|uniref:Uncharacterized protein n=1 Tax=Halocatena pleomorpha TaxID=1785090 RepID=A0A3P3RC48_9EURY|nr:hypothetical protein [Halocatena pleomorpha]RRJ30884.1 hypothetical protein EIK79_08680 [Halocatena pleomorpha]